MNPDIIVYTDGSSRGNPGPGGYGIVMQKFGTDYLKEFSEGFRKNYKQQNGASSSYCCPRKN